ncbi:MAG: hypothetical protein QOC66_2504 [Pseudonocardiales bacterium]|jgi:hemerythrin-like domain-containing protein|nr:hypothetical protein [Pseudonocardiales bacterium]
MTTPDPVDFTMMYVAHDAFTRDLQHMLEACERGAAFAAGTAAGWTAFTTQLHIHHTAEDAALWPRLRSTVTEEAELAVLDAMEAEHARIDPQLEQVRVALDTRNEAELTDIVGVLAGELQAHMRHEEVEALPLVATHLGPAGWQAFTGHLRRTQGLRGAAEFFPWLLDGASETTQEQVLGVLPPPVRLLYRYVWGPRYRRQERWSGRGRGSAPYRTRPALPPPS